MNRAGTAVGAGPVSRVAIALAVAVATVAPLALQPAEAKTLKKKNVTFEAPLPCTLICSYWLPHPPERIPFVAGDGEDYACSDPFPEGSYADIKVRAPTGAKSLRLAATPTVDWDIAICSTTGKTLAWGANEVTSCDFGCPEEAWLFGVKPGKKYILRAYNWSDPEPLRGTYWFYDE